MLLACSAYLGLFQARKVPVDDKILHFLTFFVLTVGCPTPSPSLGTRVSSYSIEGMRLTLRRSTVQLCFYWVLDTSRRRTLHLTLVICTVISGIGSEFVQGWVPVCLLPSAGRCWTRVGGCHGADGTLRLPLERPSVRRP